MKGRTKSQFKTWQRLPDLSAGGREIPFRERRPPDGGPRRPGRDRRRTGAR